MHQSVWLESLPTKTNNEKQSQCRSVKPQMPVPSDLVVSEADIESHQFPVRPHHWCGSLEVYIFPHLKRIL